MIIHLRLLCAPPFSLVLANGQNYEIYLAPFRVGANHAWALAFREPTENSQVQLLGPLRSSKEEAYSEAMKGIPLRVAKGEIRRDLADELLAAGLAMQVEKPE